MSEHTETKTRAEASKSAVEPVVMLPCPFCGHRPTISGKLGRFSVYHKCESVAAAGGVGQKKDVIARWNKRAT